MTHCISPPHVPFGINAGFDPAAEAVMGGITAQDFLGKSKDETEESKVRSTS